MTNTKKEKWYTGITRYQWLVLIVCLLGWMFDIFEGQIYVAVQTESMPSLIKNLERYQDVSAADIRAKAEWYNQKALMLFLLGGATGGIFWGMLSDRYGRKKIMAISYVFSSVFTGLTAFSMEWWHLAGMRFLVAFGVGGLWAIAAAYVAETFPSKARAYAGSMFHAFGTLGSLLAAGVGALMLGTTAVMAWAETTALLAWTHNMFEPSTLTWRLCFALGAIPAVIVFFILAYFKESEGWLKAKEEAKKNPEKRVGSIVDLFKKDTIRGTIVGVTLATIGMATFWGVHIRGKDAMLLAAQNRMIADEQIVEGRLINPEQINEETAAGLQVFRDVAFEEEDIFRLFPLTPRAEDDSRTVEELEAEREAEIAARRVMRVIRDRTGEVTRYFGVTQSQDATLKRWEMFGMVIVTLGLLIGQLSFGPLAQRIGRRGAFIFYHLGAFVIAVFVFQMAAHLTSVTPLYVLLPLFGFFTAGMHAGYAVYFPELYPARLRGTGVGFCFNMGRFFASPVLLGLGAMVAYMGISFMDAFTYLSFLYLLGPLAIYYAIETRGKEFVE